MTEIILLILLVVFVREVFEVLSDIRKGGD